MLRRRARRRRRVRAGGLVARPTPSSTPATPSPIIDRRSEAFARLGRGLRRADRRGHRVRPRPADRGGHRAGRRLAAVTNGDNSNVLIARVARENFGIERVVARIYDPRRATIYQRLGLPTVATVAWTTDQVLRRLLPDARRPSGPTRRRSCASSSARCPTLWAGRPLTDLEEAVGARVVGVGRLGSALVPTAGTVAQQGDLLYIAVEDVDGSTRSTRRWPPTAEGGTDVHVVIAGGGSVGRFIAEQLHGAGHDVLIVDNDADRRRARRAGRASPRASSGRRATPARSALLDRAGLARGRRRGRGDRRRRGQPRRSRCSRSRSSACRGWSPG